jgi:hypothetical protein
MKICLPIQKAGHINPHFTKSLCKLEYYKIKHHYALEPENL